MFVYDMSCVYFYINLEAALFCRKQFCLFCSVYSEVLILPKVADCLVFSGFRVGNVGFTGLPNWKRVRYAAALLNSDKLLSDMCKFEAEINLNGRYQELSSEQSRPVDFQRLKSTTLVGENTVVDGMTSRFRPCFFYITGRRPKTICFFHFFHMRFPSSRKSQGPNFRFVGPMMDRFQGAVGSKPRKYFHKYDGNQDGFLEFSP